jgi:serine/threonine-protein kinase
METEFDTLSVCPACGTQSDAGALLTACPRDGRLFVPLTEWFREDRSPLLGCVVGDRYAVVGGLGHGGMGDIYRAVHLATGRHVALKVLRPDTRRESLLQARFSEEAHYAAQLGGPGTVALLDAGTDTDGRAFMVFELLRGQTLAELLDVHGTLPAERVATLGEHIARALHEVHVEGLLHADLKPANIMCLGALDDTPRVKLLDFGLSRLLSRAGERTGVIAGTVAYMAPEQMTDRPCDARTDVYGLCATLWVLATGRSPHGTGAPRDVLNRKRGAAPVGAETLPPALSHVLCRGLAPDPADRWASAAALAQALQDAARPAPAPMPAGRPRLPARGLLGAALLAAAAGVAIVVSALAPETRPAPAALEPVVVALNVRATGP